MGNLLFLLMVAPFWLAWKLLVLLWHLVVMPFNQRVADASADRQAKQLAEANDAKKTAREEERQKQLDALREAVPKTIPEKMRATIQINPFKTAPLEEKRVKRLLADDSFILVEGAEHTEYAVDMILEMSETERAIIKEHELQDILLEDEPLYSPKDIERLAYEQELKAQAFKSSSAGDMWREMTEDISMKEWKAARRQFRLGDYLIAPYTRVFKTSPDANEYANKLKKKILPRIKAVLDEYREHKRTDTIEF